MNRQDRQKIGKSRIIVLDRQTFWVSMRLNDQPKAAQIVCGSANILCFIQSFINPCATQSTGFQIAF